MENMLRKTRLRPVSSTVTFLMRILILAAAVAALSALGLQGQEPHTLTTLREIHALTKAEAQGGLPVAFEATVTYYNPSNVDLFVQDDGVAIYVETKQNQDLTTGDRVLVRGKTRASFTPDVVSDSVTLLHHGDPPKPVAADFEQLIRAERDCMFVIVRAKIRSAEHSDFRGRARHLPEVAHGRRLRGRDGSGK